MRDVALGQYYPAKSVMHRLDPRIKLLLVAGYVTMVLLVNTFVGYGIIAVFLIAVVVLSRVPPRTIIRTVRPVLYMVLLTFTVTFLFYGGESYNVFFEWAFVTLSVNGLLNSLMLVCRLVLLVLGPSLLTLTTTPVELTQGIESLLKPLTLIKLPVHELAMIMSLALRMIPTLSEETHRIINAQKSRCADFESRNIIRRAKSMIPVLIPLFVSSFRRSEDLAEAMESRCYKGSKGRTRRVRLRVALRDILAIAVYAVALFVTLVVAYNFWGFGILYGLR